MPPDATRGGSIDTHGVEKLESALLEGNCVMASFTAATSVKRKNKQKGAGRRRKNAQARRSTPSATELFAALGEPGKPAPK